MITLGELSRYLNGEIFYYSDKQKASKYFNSII